MDPCFNIVLTWTTSTDGTGLTQIGLYVPKSFETHALIAIQNDLISWLLDEARGHPERRTVRILTRSVLNVNFGAIHTTTQVGIQIYISE